MERKHSPPLLESFGFSKIVSLNQAKHTGPKVFDFTAQREGHFHWIQTKSMSKAKSKLGISEKNFQAIEVLAKARETRDDYVALLMLKVSDDSDSIGNAVLLTSE